MGRLIWASPAVLWGLLTLAIPVLIHLRLRPDLRRVAFPSLRFIPTGRLAAVRRRVLRDWPLLLVRVAALALVVAALAGPIVVTPAREAAWADRVARAVVVDDAGAANDWRGVVDQATESAAFATTIEASSADGLVAAAAWLRQAPPAAREVVVVGPMRREGVTRAMLDVLPEGTGVRLVSVARGTAASTDLRRLTWIDGEVWLERREARLDDDTSALSPALDRERVSVPLEIDAPDAERALLDAAVSAVLAEGTFVEGALVSVRLVRTEAP
ncbi:MAG: BatA domain-containing protein, partial [Vicinamibacteria bacterium]